MNMNCLSYWFPRVASAGLKVPETVIFHAPVLMHFLFAEMDGPEAAKENIEQLDMIQGFINQLKSAAETLSVRHNGIPGPVFLRTGQGSGKHDWPHTCFVEDIRNIGRNVRNLVEWSEMVDMMGLDTSVWVLREMIPTAPMFTAFHGMPITREFRLFAGQNEVHESSTLPAGGDRKIISAPKYELNKIHIQPYWPESSILNADMPDEDWKAALKEASTITEEEEAYLWGETAKAFNYLDDGPWSFDWLQDRHGEWWLTDMALAGNSFFHKGSFQGSYDQYLKFVDTESRRQAEVESAP